MGQEDITFTAVFSFLVLINLVGNTLVCLIILRNPAMRTSINILIVNLALSDMMVAFSVVPQYVLKHTFVHPNGTTGDYLCRFVTGGSFLWLGDKSSIFTLVLIAFERFLGIHFPLQERGHISKHTLSKLICSSWMLALILNAPLFYVTVYQNSTPSYRCKDNWGSHHTIVKFYTIFNYIVLGVIPLATIVYLYTRVVYTLWNRSVYTSSAASENSIVQDRKRATKMDIIVSLLFGVLRFPNLALYLLSQFDRKIYNFGKPSFIWSVVLVVLNSSINPFVYSLHSIRFRRHLKNMFNFSRKASAECPNERSPLLT